MGSFLKLFRGSSVDASASESVPRIARRSSGLGELWRSLSGRDGLCVLDLGPTSASNIRHLTDLGHKVYSEDLLLASTDPSLRSNDAEGNTVVDEKRFLAENLAYDPHTFDAVLCWDMADFMEESLVKPVVARLWSVMKPGGLVLAFFHTRDAGGDAPCFRFHIAGPDTLEAQSLTVAGDTDNGRKVGRVPAYRLQRVFNNRNIENLFRDFSSLKFFLARDNVREVLITR
jgi:SAM-dependent methyltransferase